MDLSIYTKVKGGRSRSLLTAPASGPGSFFYQNISFDKKGQSFQIPAPLRGLSTQCLSKPCSLSKRKNKAGRNSSGRITMFHRGGGCKRLLRVIDFKRNILSEGVVQRLEYDPNRSARIALVKWSTDSTNGEVARSRPGVPRYLSSGAGLLIKAPREERAVGRLTELRALRSVPINRAKSAHNYAHLSCILACDSLQVGDRIVNNLQNTKNQPHEPRHGTTSGATELRSSSSSITNQYLRTDATFQAAWTASQVGNSAPLGLIPIGTFLHNIETRPGQGGRLVRSAGTFAQLIQKWEDRSVVRLPSGILKQLDSQCRATIGIVSNSSHSTRKLTKAGQNRWLGKRPIVRGVAMNPIDHPHGGGEGRTKGGRPSVSPWGKPTKGGFKRVIRKKKKCDI